MKTTEENNRAIAEFMELKGASRVGGWRYLCNDGYWRLPKRIPYDYSWDWLMPVVERIESMGYGWSISAKSFRIWSETDEESIETNRDTTMKATYQAVVEFINQLKTEK